MYQVCERPRWGIEGCIDSSTVDPAALALHDIALRRVVMLRSSVNANGALPTEDPDRPVPTVVLTTVAPCPSAEQPDPLDCWAVEVEVAVWGPAEPYQVEFQMVALFAAQPCTVTRQLLVGRLAREGADRLYQVAREHVLQSTLYGPWGPLDIGPRDLRSRFCKDRSSRHRARHRVLGCEGIAWRHPGGARERTNLLGPGHRRRDGRGSVGAGRPPRIRLV